MDGPEDVFVDGVVEFFVAFAFEKEDFFVLFVDFAAPFEAYEFTADFELIKERAGVVLVFCKYAKGLFGLKHFASGESESESENEIKQQKVWLKRCP